MKMVIYRQLENETLELVDHGMVCKAFILYLTSLTVSMLYVFVLIWEEVRMILRLVQVWLQFLFFPLW